jgi:hypothetical protein
MNPDLALLLRLNKVGLKNLLRVESDESASSAGKCPSADATNLACCGSHDLAGQQSAGKDDVEVFEVAEGHPFFEPAHGTVERRLPLKEDPPDVPRLRHDCLPVSYVRHSTATRTLGSILTALGSESVPPGFPFGDLPYSRNAGAGRVALALPSTFEGRTVEREREQHPELQSGGRGPIVSGAKGRELTTEKSAPATLVRPGAWHRKEHFRCK